MDQNGINQLGRELLFVLKEEYSFYQSLFIILDKQKDIIKYKRDEHLLDLFAEIERCQKRINRSNEKIEALRQKSPELFQAALNLPDIKKIVNSIATLIKKNMNLVGESEEYLKGKYERIKAELGELQNSKKILQYLNTSAPRPQFVDGKK